MTRKQATEAWQQGAHTMVVEYRSGAATAVDYRDKTTGKPARFCKCTHNVEAGPLAFAISERLKEDADLPNWKAPFKKGTICLFTVSSYKVESGATSATGTLEALTD